MRRRRWWVGIGIIAWLIAAREARAQDKPTALDATFNLTVRQVSVDSALHAIADSAGVAFDFDASHVRAIKRRVTLTANRMTVRRALAIVLRGTDLRARLYRDGNVVIVATGRP